MINLTALERTHPLIIMDLANNHDGSLSHAKKIIDDICEVTKNFDFPIAIKFQYRDLPNFIQQDYQHRFDLKYVDRFLSTKMEWEDYLKLRNYIKDKGLLAACTPFDEFSVDKIIEHDFDILKVASVSFTDWPLLEKIGESWTGPLIASTAGVNESDLDRVVTFLSNRKMNFAIMHCVAAYPTKNPDLILSRITTLKKKFQNLSIGYSTHEDPGNMLAAPLALASGAVILERHVASSSEGHSVNQYSSELHHLKNWLQSISSALEMLGPENVVETHNSDESNSLAGLRRYQYASKDIEIGEILNPSNMLSAIPGKSEQLSANDVSKYVSYKSLRKILKGEPLLKTELDVSDSHDLVRKFRNKVVDLIKISGVSAPSDALLELSHHYGIEKFGEYGCSMITVVNREYCKKLIILLPGQMHPPMFHKIKDETFFLAYGDVTLKLDGKETYFEPGAVVNIAPGVVHEFQSSQGAVIEEISTTHAGSDSFYVDKEITKSLNRKTFISYWG
jgi:sialic acid synthase SpsE/mannose-6-phosphate isomerase-like protein (cupin superfamily)